MGAPLDLTNKKFGKLTAIRVATKEERPNPKQRYWVCQCDCGKQTVVLTNYLTSGHTKSCGCQRAISMSETMSTNLINKQFGKLTVKNKTDLRASDGCIIWECQCDCGNIHYVNTNSLKNGDIQSCGCQRSRGEAKINAILFENNINYATQFWFKDLKDKKYLYFDFAIFDDNQNIKYLIEYQGVQHYLEDQRGKWKSPKEHDQMKREYCKNHNIPLIEIPYTDFDKIDFDYLKNKLSL